MKEHQPQTDSKIRLMLVSLLLSLVTWISLSGRSNEDTQTRVFPQIPLLHKNVPPNMKLKTDNYQISVALNGPEKDLNAINPSSDIKVMLNLEGYSEGEWTMPLTSEDVMLSAGKNLRVENIIPETVRLQLERVATKNIRLVMETVGKPAKNFELKSVELNPSEVTITGPAARLKNLEYLEAEPVNIQDARNSITGRIILNSGDIPADAVIRQLGNLRFTITIEEMRTRKRFKEPYPIQQAEPPVTGIKMSPEQVLLEVEGPISAVDWFEQSWVIPELLVSEFIAEEPLGQTDVEGSNQPENEDKTPQKQMVPISTRWVIPEEVSLNNPNLANKISKLQLKWIPGQVEVEKQ